VMLFFLQNVFNQQVYREVRYSLSSAVLAHLAREDIDVNRLKPLIGESIAGGARFRDRLESQVDLSPTAQTQVIDAAEIHPMTISDAGLAKLDREYISPAQASALEDLRGRSFQHRWQLAEALSKESEAWRKRDSKVVNKPFNKHLAQQLDYLYRLFSAAEPTGQ
jgi:hypothetical protein